MGTYLVDGMEWITGNEIQKKEGKKGKELGILSESFVCWNWNWNWNIDKVFCST
jgi:hypothetical protein